MTLHRYTPYYKPLTMLGVPIVVGQLGTIVLAFADTLMIGHHATSELAAAAFVNNIINLVIIFALGFSYAVTPTVGTLYGQEKTQRIGEMVRNAICANLLLAALIVGVMGGILPLHRPPGPTRGAAAADQALLPRAARLPPLRLPLQRLQAVCRRHH